MNDRARNIVIIAVVVVALGLVVVLSWGSRTDASSARDSSDKAVSATADIAEVLNRRSPVLVYLSCADGRDQAVDATEKAFLLGLVDKAFNLDQLRAAYVDAVAVRAKTNKPEAEGGCGGLPTGG